MLPTNVNIKNLSFIIIYDNTELSSHREKKWIYLNSNIYLKGCLAFIRLQSLFIQMLSD